MPWDAFSSPRPAPALRLAGELRRHRGARAHSRPSGDDSVARRWLIRVADSLNSTEDACDEFVTEQPANGDLLGHPGLVSPRATRHYLVRDSARRHAAVDPFCTGLLLHDPRLRAGRPAQR